MLYLITWTHWFELICTFSLGQSRKKKNSTYLPIQIVKNLQCVQILAYAFRIPLVALKWGDWNFKFYLLEMLCNRWKCNFFLMYTYLSVVIYQCKYDFLLGLAVDVFILVTLHSFAGIIIFYYYKK